VKTLTLKTGKAMEVLCLALEISSKSLIDKVIDGLDDLGCIENHFTDAGQTVKEVLEKSNIPLWEFVTVIGLPYVTGDIMKMIGEILLWGDADQCPECGSEIIITNDGFDDFEWEEHRCVNHNCGYSTTTEPDFDTMKGGKDYNADFNI